MGSGVAVCGWKGRELLSWSASGGEGVAVGSKRSNGECM